MTTTVTLNPASTVTSAGITLFGGAGSLHATLSDGSDATYAHNAAAAFGKVVLDTLAVPTGGVVQFVVLKLRCRRAASPTQINASVNGHTPTTFTPPTGSGWGTLSSVSIAQAISNADLAAGLTLLWLDGPSGTSDIAKAYVEVTYVPLPTLNVTAPTGTIGVSRPTVTWDVTGDYPQERFRVKLFSSAQYSGVGFNVETSTALYDSGEQVGSTDTFVPTFNLSNGVTYRYYVKVAQKVGATTQWSAWDSVQPTVSVSAADVPALTVTPSHLFGNIKIVATNGGSPTWQFVTIERTADGGVTWTAVRNADRAAVTGSTITVYDYESGNAEQVQYRVQSIVSDPAGDIASEWSTPTATTAWTSPGTWLKCPTQPLLNRYIYIESIPSVIRRIPRGVLDVAGRRDPIVVSDTRKLIEGTVTLLTLTDVQADGIRALLDTSETLLLQTPAEDGFGSRYIACGDEDEQRTSRLSTETSRRFVVPFLEVTAPVGEVITFGSTWDDLVAAFADWDAVLAAFPTWNAVLAAHL